MEETPTDAGRVVTLPEIAKRIGVTSRIAGRIFEQYRDQLPEPQRVGIIRTWPESAIELFASLLATERRARGDEL